MSHKITTKSFYGTNQITNFNEMTTKQQAEAIQSIANTGAIIDTFEENHKEILRQNEVNQAKNLELLREQNDIAKANEESNRVLGMNVEELNHSVIEFGSVLSDFSEKNIHLLNTINGSILTTIKQMSLLNRGVDSIIELLRVPEFEKERIFYIKEAFKYLSLSIDTPKRSVDALHYFIKAHELNRRDVIVNYNIALLLQHRSHTANTLEARKYLDLALDYVHGDDKLKSTILSELAYNETAKGNFSKAAELCIEASKFNGRNSDAIIYLLNIGMITKDYFTGIGAVSMHFDLPTVLKAIKVHMYDWDYYSNINGTFLDKLTYRVIEGNITKFEEFRHKVNNEGKLMIYSDDDGLPEIKQRLNMDLPTVDLSVLSDCIERFRNEYGKLDINNVIYRN